MLLGTPCTSWTARSLRADREHQQSDPPAAARSQPRRRGRPPRALVALSTALIASAPPAAGGPGARYFPVAARRNSGDASDQAQEQPRPHRRRWLLHTCGHTCGQPRGAATVGTPAADDLWAKVAAAVRAQLSEATWNTWFQGVHALDLHRRHPDARRPELGRRRAHPHQLPRPARRRGPGAHRRPARRSSSLVDTAPRADDDWSRSISSPTPRPTSRVDERPPRRRGRAGATRGPRTSAESPLHVRPVRHRRVEPLRARGRAVASPRARPVRTTRCSSTGRPGSARPTCCTRSATTCASCSRASASATSRPRR